MKIEKPRDICQIIKTIREAVGMSQDDLSLNSGVSKSTIVSIETGRRLPSLEVMFALVESFGYKVELEIKPNYANSKHK